VHLVVDARPTTDPYRLAVWAYPMEEMTGFLPPPNGQKWT